MSNTLIVDQLDEVINKSPKEEVSHLRETLNKWCYVESAQKLFDAKHDLDLMTVECNKRGERIKELEEKLENVNFLWD